MAIVLKLSKENIQILELKALWYNVSPEAPVLMETKRNDISSC